MSQVTRTMQKIDHEGKQIVTIDCTNIGMHELANEILTNEQWVNQNYSSQNKALMLVDVSNCHIDMDALKAFQSSGKTSKERTKGIAVVGITGHRKILLDAVNKFSSLDTKTFNSREEAIEWLVSL